VLRHLPDSCEARAGKQCECSPRNIEAPGHHTTYYLLNNHNQTTRSSATAQTTHDTIRSVISTDQLTLTVALNMIYVNFISLIELSIHSIVPSYFVLANSLNCFKSRLDKECLMNNSV